MQVAITLPPDAQCSHSDTLPSRRLLSFSKRLNADATTHTAQNVLLNDSFLRLLAQVDVAAWLHVG